MSAGLRLTPLGGAFVGAWIGAMIPATVIGSQITAAQLPEAPLWFAFGVGLVSGPLVLLGELADVFGGDVGSLRILPWAVPAAVLAGWLGRRLAASGSGDER